MKDLEAIKEGSDIKPEPMQGEESLSQASVKKRKGRPPGALKSSAELAQDEVEPESGIGPADAAPHWQAFYRSIRDAVADMRSK